jgi:hypothetical protein
VPPIGFRATSCGIARDPQEDEAWLRQEPVCFPHQSRIVRGGWGPGLRTIGASPTEYLAVLDGIESTLGWNCEWSPASFASRGASAPAGWTVFADGPARLLRHASVSRVLFGVVSKSSDPTPRLVSRLQPTARRPLACPLATLCVITADAVRGGRRLQPMCERLRSPRERLSVCCQVHEVW